MDLHSVHMIIHLQKVRISLEKERKFNLTCPLPLFLFLFFQYSTYSILFSILFVCINLNTVLIDESPQRIDYIFYAKQDKKDKVCWVLSDCKIVKDFFVLHGVNKTLIPVSDHYGVSATFTIDFNTPPLTSSSIMKLTDVPVSSLPMTPWSTKSIDPICDANQTSRSPSPASVTNESIDERIAVVKAGLDIVNRGLEDANERRQWHVNRSLTILGVWLGLLLYMQPYHPWREAIFWWIPITNHVRWFVVAMCLFLPIISVTEFFLAMFVVTDEIMAMRGTILEMKLCTRSLRLNIIRRPRSPTRGVTSVAWRDRILSDVA